MYSTLNLTTNVALVYVSNILFWLVYRRLWAIQEANKDTIPLTAEKYHESEGDQIIAVDGNL